MSLREKCFSYLKDNPDASRADLMANTGASRSYAYNILQKWKKKQPFEQEQTETTIKEEQAQDMPQINVEETVITAELEEPSTVIPEKVKGMIEKGEFEAEDVEYFLNCINMAIPEQHRRPSKAMTFLGKLWYRPFNKIFEQQSEQNPQLILALVATGIVFAPAAVGVVKDWQEQRKQQPKK